MNQTPGKKLSDMARETNVAKASKFSSSMIPQPPPPKPKEEEKPAMVSEADEEQQPAETIATPEQTPLAVVDSAPQPKAARSKRANNGFTIDELIQAQPPKDEGYPKQVRISAKHHRLLREVSFKKDVTINHVLYNLLDQLYEANQRDNQSNA
ncbi:hypothetical protein CLV58_115136 [Spirosoma oryzae]|uniref:Uncharacterized protein n=1 Tax=Spirosoma oryzae TaxID=1469603 RepID=A0A2T0SNV6_9BACT|nr:hypothetical protein [Spirosoma oryzae]PRY35053.1 hypothetical protein CLV58_115136 [Spirosoma oryzae]